MGRGASEATGRVRQALWPIVQTSLAAGLAWYLIHTLLGAPQPSFAPIAATVSVCRQQRGGVAVVVSLVLFPTASGPIIDKTTRGVIVAIRDVVIQAADVLAPASDTDERRSLPAIGRVYRQMPGRGVDQCARDRAPGPQLAALSGRSPSVRAS